MYIFLFSSSFKFVGILYPFKDVLWELEFDSFFISVNSGVFDFEFLRFFLFFLENAYLSYFASDDLV